MGEHDVARLLATRNAAFRQGFRDEALLMPGMLAWGLVAGVAMVKGGLTVPAALAMGLLVYSAGAQFSAMALMATHAPLWIIVATAACVNLRFVIFSAGLRPYLVHLPLLRRLSIGYLTADLSYVVFMKRFGESSARSPEQVPYLCGCCAANWLGWQGASSLGVLFAERVPGDWGLDFAGVLALLGLACSLITSRAALLGSLAAFATAILTRDLPLRLNTVVAIACGIAVALACEPRAPAPSAAT